VSEQPGVELRLRHVEFAAGGPVPLRSLIEHVVRAEVGAFADRQQQRRFVQVLTAADLERGVAAGKVDSGGRRAGPPPDVDAAVRAAWQAFEDGLYIVFVDDEQVERLDQPVIVGTASRVRFLRLVPLVGG
jgi:hypothetical protein